MELTRTEVSCAVVSRQCDSIFAVYSILLQEELKQNSNKAAKTISSPVICDHCDTARIVADVTARKRRKMNDSETICSRNILQKNKLRNAQAKRHWAMKKRVQNCERLVNTFQPIWSHLTEKTLKICRIEIVWISMIIVFFQTMKWAISIMFFPHVETYGGSCFHNCRSMNFQIFFSASIWIRSNPKWLSIIQS